MAEQFVEIKLSVPWGHVAARTYGSSTGKPVLVLHGFEDNAGSFTRLMKYLPKEAFYYVCVDLPGHGWSTAFPSWMMIDWISYSHTLHFILDALQWKTCILLGHSMGAQIALMYSILQPNRFEKLISIDGILVLPKIYNFKNMVQYFKTASAFSVHAYYKKHNEKLFATKEEVLRHLMTKRIVPMNYEAADAIFERAVTEVNGKYMYKQEVRLINFPNAEIMQRFTNELPKMSIYLFILSEGFINPNKEKELILETMKAKTMLEIIYLDGNHNLHNNDPEKIASFICKILLNSNSNKL